MPALSCPHHTRILAEMQAMFFSAGVAGNLIEGEPLSAFCKNVDSSQILIYTSLMVAQLIAKEKFTSVQVAQAGITRLFQSANDQGVFYRVLRNNEPLGVLVPNDFWDELLEDLEALSSPTLDKDLLEALDYDKTYSSQEVKKSLGL